jgi:hypothetical protein
VTPSEYVNEIVVPTIKEFRDNRTSRRHAYLACIVIFHIKEHLRVFGETNIDVVMKSKAFDSVRSICNGTKHVVTDASHNIRFESGTDYVRPPAFCNVMICGLSYLGDTKGGREIFDGRARIDLYGACREALQMFKLKFPTVLANCDLSDV